MSVKRVLFADGKKVGEISDWEFEYKEPVYKTFLGKTALLTPANDQCSFTSPKPVKRKSELTLIEDGKTEYVLQTLSLKGLRVTCKITTKKNLK